MYAPAIGDPPPGCTCGPYWSVIPPGPCPHHAPPQWVLVPVQRVQDQTTRWYPATTGFGTITVTSANSATFADSVTFTHAKSPDNPIA